MRGTSHEMLRKCLENGTHPIHRKEIPRDYLFYSSKEVFIKRKGEIILTSQ